MLKLVRMKNTEKICYFYFPEGRTEPGIIEIDKNNQAVVIQESTYDKEVGAPFFANKARAYVQRMWDSNNLLDEKLFAWG